MADAPLIFLSYASQDRDRVIPYYDHLKASGLNVWMDKHNLKGGQNWDLEIKRALQKAVIIACFLSSQSISKRGYVQREIKIALDQAQAKLADDIYLIPVLLDPNATIPGELAHIHAISGTPEEMYEALRASIYAQLERLGSIVTVADASQPFTWSIRDYTENWEGLPGYDVRLELIELQSSKFHNISEINDIVRGWLLGALHTQRAVKFDQSPDAFSFGQERFGRTNSWEATCSEPVITGTTLSILYAVWWYGAGAAHPNHFYRSFCFSLDPLIHIKALEDIFEKHEEGLRVLQEYTRDYFLQKKDPEDEAEYDAQWVASGTQDWNSFGAFSFTKEGVEIFFPPYQVASYADGAKRVVVPYTELVGTMDKNFQHLLGVAYLKHWAAVRDGALVEANES